MDGHSPEKKCTPKYPDLPEAAVLAEWAAKDAWRLGRPPLPATTGDKITARLGSTHAAH